MLIPVVTERLLIRPPAPTDIEAMHRVFSDPEVMRYIPVARIRRELIIICQCAAARAAEP